MLLSAMVCYCCMPLPLLILGVMIKPLSESFGWSRAAITVSILMTATGTMLFAPAAGFVADRIGPRRVALVGLLLLGAAIAGIGLSGPMIITWFIAWAIYAVVQPFAGNPVWCNAVTSRFDANRGMALAVMLTGGAVLYSVLPIFTVAVMQHWGWRAVYFSLGAFVILFAWPIAWRFFYGASDLARIAKAQRAKEAPAVPVPPELTGHSAGEALRTRAFWQIALACIIAASGVSVVVVHLQPILGDAGLSPVAAASVAFIFAPAAIFGRFGVGFLVDRLPSKYVAAAVLLLPAISYSILLVFDGTVRQGLMICAAIAIAESAETSLVAYLVSRYFGQRSFGVIYGLLLGAFSMGYGIAPVVAGRVFDTMGSYHPIYGPLGGASLVGALLMATLGPYPRFTPVFRAPADTSLIGHARGAT
jgi:MFS family permease